MRLQSIFNLSLCLFAAETLGAKIHAAKTNTSQTSTDHPTLYLIRHGEKPADPENHDLTFDGLVRAQCLRWIFGADSGYDIEHIMAPTVKWSKLFRP